MSSNFDWKGTNRRLKFLGEACSHVQIVAFMATINEAVRGGNSMTTKLSVIVPVLNERENVEPLAKEVLEELTELQFQGELIFVDDGSTDGTGEVIDRLADADSRVRAVHLRRNFGKAAALTTGFHYADGGFFLTIDGDGQDDPSEIPRLLAKLEEGYDLVSGWKEDRKDPWHKRLMSRAYNYLTSILGGLRLRDHNSGFKLYRREVLDRIDLVGEMHRFVTVMAYWQGFSVTEIPVRHRARRSGQSKYGMARIFKGAFDFLTVVLTTRYQLRPLHLFGTTGLLFTAAGIAVLAYLTLLWFLGERPIGTRPLFFLGLLLTMVGVQVITTGLVAELVIRQPLTWGGGQRDDRRPPGFEHE